MKEEQYGVAIYLDGIIEYFEYDNSQENWEQRIGQADPTIDDTSFYARTRQFYDDPENNDDGGNDI